MLFGRPTCIGLSQMTIMQAIMLTCVLITHYKVALLFCPFHIATKFPTNGYTEIYLKVYRSFA